ncbi:hypothetical protein L1X30_16780, partial [Acinetobacter baumannii]|nr:hypothetical protein [Acinetobacter baumannii]
HLPKLRLKFGSIRGALPFKSLCNKAGGNSNPPFLPDCSQGTIHLIGYEDGCSFGINLNKEEAEAFITELRSLIMQYQEPRHFIFAPHMHLAKD